MNAVTIWLLVGLWLLGFWPMMASDNARLVQLWAAAPILIPAALIAVLGILSWAFRTFERAASKFRRI